MGCVLWELETEVVCECDCQVKGTFVPVANAVLGGIFDERVAGHYSYDIQMNNTKACIWDKIKDVI